MFPLPLEGVDEFSSRIERAWLNGRACVRRDALCMGLGLLGIRWIECSRLVLGDLLSERALLHVPSAKGGLARVLPTGHSWMYTMLAVRRLFPNYAADAPLFVTTKGRPLDYQNILRRCRAWTKTHFGRPYTFHCLRHTAAVRHYLATRDVFSVQRLLGHRSLKWTAEYLASLQIVPTAGLPPFVDGGFSGPRLFDPGDVLAVREQVMVRPMGSSSRPDGRKREAAAEAKRQNLLPGDAPVWCLHRKPIRRWVGNAFGERQSDCPCENCRDCGRCDWEAFFRERFVSVS